jgi:hypothetical protein
METLPEVARIEGLEFRPGPTFDQSTVLLQYTDHKQSWKQVTMPFVQAMMLLTYLRQMQVEQRYEMPSAPLGQRS